MAEFEKTSDGRRFQGAEQAQIAPYTSCPPQKSFARRLYGWTAWVASVAFTSFAITHFGPKATPSTSIKASEVVFLTSNESSIVPQPSRLTRRAECATGGVENPEEYNTPMHVGALFIILAVSFLGCAFPILASKVPGLRIPGRFFFIVRHFGTGVLIATAFVHLLPTAFQNLSNPCLGKFWTEDYPAMPGAIALAAVFLVAVIEMVFHPARHIPPASIVSNRGVGCMAAVHTDSNASEPHQCAADGTSHPVRDMGPLAGRSSSVGQGLTNLAQSPSLPSEAAVASAPSAKENDEKTAVADMSVEQSSAASTNLRSEPQMRKDRLQCVLLEMGILFHSVFIGMAISVSVGNEFIVLLIAISFHQTFEGLALGSRIAQVRWEKDTIQPWLLALAYGCTTPLGQAIGLAVHNLYSQDSEVGLLMVGIMNAISAGLLTFASLVELLSEDFLSDESWRYLRGKERVFACALVLLGAFGMSVVGAWA